MRLTPHKPGPVCYNMPLATAATVNTSAATAVTTATTVIATATTVVLLLCYY